MRIVFKGLIKEREKTMKHVIKHLLIAIVIVLSTSGVVGQTTEHASKLNRKEKRAVERERLYQSNKQMLENRSFVVETDYLQNHYGVRIPVNSSINFIMVDAGEAVIQIGSNTGMGYNGVGGITAKGKITNWELKENEKKKTFDLSMHILTSIGMYDVNMTIGNFGATARISGIRRGNLMFDGDMVALEESAVYEGQSL